MPDPARFCARCGGAIEVRPIDDRPREVCARCGKVFYRNPLPVASSVVLNDAREVLLVKRGNDPHRGMWCLPAGFAERDETIGDAALRELREETGIEGRIVRLLAAASTQSDFYGDLLFVTFEVAKSGGTERAGDDAEETAYFPLSRVPPLAFAPHDDSVRTCADLHREEWAIQDSFGRLQVEGGQDLLSDALVTLIRDQAGAISSRWLRAVRAKASLPTYARAEPGTVRGNALAVLRQFRRWLAGGIPDAEMRAFFRALGIRRRAEGYALPEVLSALSLLRREMWLVARESLVSTRLLDVYRVMELDLRTVLFFDRAHYQIARGYTDPADDDPPASP